MTGKRKTTQYRACVQWIAENDETACEDAAEMATLVTVTMLADVWGFPVETVAGDVMTTRRKWLRSFADDLPQPRDGASVERPAMPLGGYWILDDERRPVRVATVEEWGRFYETTDRVVAKDIIGDAEVSTVFLGLDHQFGDGPPILFETMIFGGAHDMHQDRCSTWQQAEAMHAKACALVRAS